MRGPGLPIVILLTLSSLLAGCLSDAPSPLQEPEPARPAGQQTALSDDCVCWEPTVAVGSDGTVYATNGWASRIWVQPPGAEPHTVDRPVSALAPWLGALPADVMLQIDHEGRLVYHSLLYHLENNAAYGALILLGIHVAVSEDGGETWPINTYVALPDSQQAPQLGADRQWLAAAPDGTLYLVYQRVPPVLGARVGDMPVTEHYMLTQRALMFSRSDDGGATWSEFRPITQPGPTVINGQPQVASDGRLFVPFFRYGDDQTLSVAVSDDRGETFATHAVYDQPGGPGAWFPSLAVSEDDRLDITWVGADQTLNVATSHDAGATWSMPATWTRPAEEVETSPWALVHNDTLHILWYRTEGETSSSLWWSKAPLDDVADPTHDLIDPLVNGSSSRSAMTDFAHAVLGPDATLHTVWTDREAGGLRHLVQPIG